MRLPPAADSPRVTSKPEVILRCMCLRYWWDRHCDLSGRAPSAQCFSTACHSGVLDFCFSLLQVGVDCPSYQFGHRGPCDLLQDLQLGHLARSHEQRCPKHCVLHDTTLTSKHIPVNQIAHRLL